MKNRIGWCNATWNPCWGCAGKRECVEYCYARAMARRFWDSIARKELRYLLDNGFPDYDYSAEGVPLFLKRFNPIFLESHFVKKLPKKPHRIFVGSMSEIAHWETMWVLRVLDKIEQHPQHIFQFLTKYPDVYLGYKFPSNCHLGITITRFPKSLNNERMSIIEFLNDTCFDNLKFISFEPLLESINFKHLDLRNIGWVIIGAETGKRRGKVVPDPLWIDEIIQYCRNKNIPIYLKDNLKDIYPEEIKEFPINRTMKALKKD